MNTPTHALLSLFTFGARADRLGVAALIVGGVAPDVPIFILYAWATWVARIPEAVIWSHTYYQPGWQTAVDAAHSVPIAGLIAVAGALRSRSAAPTTRSWHPLTLLGASLTLHSALDLPVHHDDGHRHFWPLSAWRFDSPVSYWDPCCFGDVVSLVEIAVMLGVTAVLWRRGAGPVARAALALLGLVYVGGAATLILRAPSFPWLGSLLSSPGG